MVKPSDAGECQSLTRFSRCCKLSRISILATRPVEYLVFSRLQQLPDNAAAAEVPQADEKPVHVLCRELLRCGEQASVTCWPAQDPEGEPPDPQRRQGRQGRRGQHQRAVRAQGLQHATRRSEKAVRQGIRVRKLCWEIIVIIILSIIFSFPPVKILLRMIIFIFVYLYLVNFDLKIKYIKKCKMNIKIE